MRLFIWSLVSGLLVAILVIQWPPAWEYAPGLVFGLTMAAYFIPEKWKDRSRRFWGILQLAGFVVLSYAAYVISLQEAEWVLGTNGFASFNSYNQSSALAALFVGSFVGGCIGAFVLAIGIRYFLFRFDLVRGLFVFSIFSGMLGSAIVVGFEMFGFIPQFLFPVWHAGVAGVILYLRRIA